MKKIFTLLAIMFGIVGSMNAQTTTLDLNGDSENNKTVADLIDDLGGFKNVDKLYSYDANTNTLVVSIYGAYQSAGSQTWVGTDGSGSASRTWSGTGVFKGSSYYHTSTTAKTATSNSSRLYKFQVKGLSSVSALVKSGNTKDRTVIMQVLQGTDVKGEAKSVTGDYDVITVRDLDPAKNYVVTLTSETSSNSDVYEIAFVSGTPSSNPPTLNADETELNLQATADNPSVNGAFKLTGANLTNGTYNLSIPSVDGLTVSPTSFTVANGTVEQEFTVTYAPTENVIPASVNIVATTTSDDDVNASVTVNYAALLTSIAATTVSDNTTWDIENGISGSADVASPTEEIYANLLGLTFADSFDATSLYVTANEFAWRESVKCAQACTLKFITEVPGTITVTFSNTGSNNNGRWVKVTDANGEQTGTVEAVGTTKKTESFDVAAGTVSITGTGALRFFKIEFVKANGVSVTIPASGYATLCSSNDVVSNGECYKATKLVNGVVTIVPVQGVIPSGTGIIVKGEAGTVTLPIATEGTTEAALSDNKMVGVLTDTDMTGKSCYILSDGAFWPCSGGTLAAGKAYLDIAPTSGAKAIEIDVDGQETAISTVNAEQLNGNIYTINGVQVKNAQQKGIYIINGKKVVK